MGKLKVFSASFRGHYPVGACAVIVAKDKEHAELLLEKDLRERHLWDKQQGESVSVTEIDTDNAVCLVLLDGDY